LHFLKLHVIGNVFVQKICDVYKIEEVIAS